MESKLQLHEIVGYLPYALKALKGVTRVELTSISLELNHIYHTSYLGSRRRVVSLYDEIKPILRPLSDLTKEIEVNGEKFVPLDRLKLDSCLDYNVEFTDYFSLLDTISDLQKLYHWHFDIHDLINRNLAIDINTLKNER